MRVKKEKRKKARVAFFLGFLRKSLQKLKRIAPSYTSPFVSMNSPRVTIFRAATTYSVPEASASVSPLIAASAPAATSKQLYYDRNCISFAQEKGDDILEDPITMEEMPAYVPGETISYLRLAGRCPVGMRFFTLSSLQQCLQRNNIDPFTNLPWKGAMRRRVEIASLALLRASLALPQAVQAQDTPLLFQEFIQNPTAFKARPEYAWLEQNLHIGDAGILSTWTDSMRDKAIETLENAPRGSWLIRNSSLKSTDLVTVQAISYVRTERTDVPAKISHVLVMHVRGYGYAIAEAERGQLMPTTTSKDIPLPEHDGVHGSFLEVMEWMHENANNFDIRRMRTF